MAIPALGPIIPAVWMSVAAVIVVSVIVLPSVLTLPEVFSCNPEDKAYYVVIIDPPTLNSSWPPVICPYYEGKKSFVR